MTQSKCHQHYPETIDLDEVVIVLREHGTHFTASLRYGGLVFGTYSHYRDPRLTDAQVDQLRSAARAIPGWRGE